MWTVLFIAFPAFSGILLSIGVLRMKRPFFTLALHSVALLDVLISEQDDDEKFEAVNIQTSKTVKSLLLNLTLLSALIALTFCTYYYLPGHFWADVLPEQQKLFAFGVGTLLPFLYPKKKQSAYSPMAQLFHRLILNHYHLGKALLKRQIKGIEHPVQADQTTAVLITGLARAGTTALTRALTDRGPFASLDYSNMPVLLAPRLWSKFYKPKKKEDKERAHGDGIKVGLASVEALEEYFFKVTTNDRFISDTGLHLHEISAEENDLYRRYTKSLCNVGQVYLAKNNNAVLRLKSMLPLNPDMTVFVLVRDPLQHAFSLMKQHQKFEKEQTGDPFILEYMNWLGHHEFGLGQLPFNLSGSAPQQTDRGQLNYWLERWIDYYNYAKTLSNIQFIAYEDFVARPKEALERISTATGITLKTEGVELFEKTALNVPVHDTGLAARALEIYREVVPASRA
ncbi:sulfotransferase [Schleiferiaceae bacterium]|nr:sulfotransferase [Schleiferiaceae bacterium]